MGHPYRRRPDGAGLEKYTDLSELWDEDELTWSEISCVINSTKDWGSIPGEFAEKLIASTKSRINWRTALAGFRSSILCSRRRLTRMKPSRRSGFDGVVILTDGYAPEPAIPQGFRCGILWVCENRESFSTHEHWMKRSGRVCVMELH